MPEPSFAQRKRFLTGLLGAPIAHSASPAMHERAGQALGLDCHYHLMEIAGADVAQLRTDMASDEVTETIQEHGLEAGRYGVDSTPTILVGPTGGTLEVVETQSATDVEAVAEAIENALGQ